MQQQQQLREEEDFPSRPSRPSPLRSDPNRSDVDDCDDDDNNPWRDEIVWTLFGDVGRIRRDFSCAIERKILLHGRLYVTERFVCFYSNLFGFEKKIKIPYMAITYISKPHRRLVVQSAKLASLQPENDRRIITISSSSFSSAVGDFR